ncbi:MULTISPECIES: inovirus Gp2 family protein [unclassified Vibrio]|uniref:inovirus Gp2 family protein n=1 Tax=unclassified Vibrio TaxID=2614977 RepID=UPI001F30B823|nr:MULTISPECIES: inovirus Gp2 family protein [unclassified Vibrio]MCF7489299.1 inovirus Gp2 family protein [Vibrio sp. G-C-1]
MKLIESEFFNGYSVIRNHGPLIQRILMANELMMVKSLSDHNRLLVMRFELKFPTGYSGPSDIISKFFDSLRFKIQYDLKRKSKNRNRSINCRINYVWVKELSGNEGWHYHVALVLNYNVYRGFGKIGSTRNNTINRISEAWASAIKCSVNNVKGLVNIPNGNPVYELNKRSPSFHDTFYAVMFRLSYLAKLKTKPYGGNVRMRFYGTSKS